MLKMHMLRLMNYVCTYKCPFFKTFFVIFRSQFYEKKTYKQRDTQSKNVVALVVIKHEKSERMGAPLVCSRQVTQ